MGTKRKRYNTRRVAVERYIYQLGKRFGMSAADYVAMGIGQGWCCLICGRSRDELEQDLVVDHNHRTGKVRGLLCKGCNQALGLMRDNTVWLNQAIRYLQREPGYKFCALALPAPEDV